MKIKDIAWRTAVLMVGLTVVLPLVAQAATTYLSPSGDDTPAIQAALNNCIGATTACVVQLSAGTFHTRQLTVQNFRGALRGAGKTKTVILAASNLEITNKTTWYKALPGQDNTWPYLMTFVDGAIDLQGFTIQISEAKPITGYTDPYLTGTTAYYMSAAVLLTSTNHEPMPSSVDNVGFEGKVVDQASGTPFWTPYNLYMGYTVQVMGDMPVWTLPHGSYSITASGFARMAMGVGFYDLGPSRLTVGGNAEKGNSFDDAAIAVAVSDFDGSIVEVSFNRMTHLNPYGVFAGQDQYIQQSAASDLLIRNNTIQGSSQIPNAGQPGQPGGLLVWDNMGGGNSGPRWNAKIFSNDIDFGISLVNVSGATVQGNRISGTADNAIYVGGYLPASRNALTGNNLEQFRPHPGWTDILLDTTSEYCTVNGSGNSTVTDKGTGNIIYGAHRQ
jgi:hypothetical protein